MNVFEDPVFQQFNAHSVKLVIEKLYKAAEEGYSEKVTELLNTLTYAINIPGSGYGPEALVEIRSRTQEILEKAKNDVPPSSS
jgi:hypothetical protein